MPDIVADIVPEIVTNIMPAAAAAAAAAQASPAAAAAAMGTQRARKGWCDRLSQLVPDIVSVSHCDCLSKGHSFRSYSRQT